MSIDLDDINRRIADDISIEEYADDIERGEHRRQEG